MNLKEKINNDLKESMKSGDKLRLETVRSIRALILEHEKSGKDKDLTPEEEIGMLTSAAKKRKDSIEQFKAGNRLELAEKEEKELAIIQSYLPKQLDEDDILSEVKKIAEEIGAKTKQDFPKLMPATMKILKGKADGAVIRKVIENFLESN